MTLQYCSDLHLEFQENKRFIVNNPLEPRGDILLLAGDIVPFAAMDKHNDFFDYASDNFETTFWVPGNHEYYNSDASQRSGILHEAIRSNVHLVNNKVIDVGDVSLIFTTLWTNISPEKQPAIERGMSDFRAIQYKGNPFTANDYNLLHRECLDFLKKSLMQQTATHRVVVSHHVPTIFQYPEKFRNSPLTEGFVIELFSTIEESGPDVWIYGHHHANVPDFSIGKTELTTNQLGYIRQKEHLEYRPFKYLIY